MAELDISRFFETPLIRQAFDGDFGALADAVRARRADLPEDGRWGAIDPAAIGPEGAELVQQIVALAERFSVDAHARPPRHIWGLSLAARIVGPGKIVAPIWEAGAFWHAIMRLDGASGADLMIDDPRMPMPVMHEPGVRLRAPDGVSEEGAQTRIELVPAEAVLMPGWLRCGLENRTDAEVIELGLSLFARLAGSPA